MGAAASARWLERPQLQRLIDVLRERGYTVLGPRVRDGSVAWASLERADELPIGWRDEQEPGRYRLTRTSDSRAFGVVHGPESLKRWVFAPREPLLRVEVQDASGRFHAEPLVPPSQPLAVLGARACDLAGLATQDRIFLHDRTPDPAYAARRRGLFLVAVNCTRSVSTCFCASMGTGPEATQGFDLALTELESGFVVRAGSAAGTDLLAALDLPEAAEPARAEEREAIDACARGLERRLDAEGVRELLYANLEHPRWDEVAERCLSCGNCTMVCPTCFCHDERDEPSLDGRTSLRVREWDSCFNRDHGYIHGMNFRPRIRDRYRQWLVHKLASWVDQFERSGCVGCGRCIVWCPVGIDLTEEVAAIRDTPR